MITRNTLREEYKTHKLEIEKLNGYFYYLIYRPLSFYITPVFIKKNIHPNYVTLITLALVVFMPIALLFKDISFLLIALLSFSYSVLDCVDGTFARNTGKTSVLGMYLDSIFGKLHLIMMIFMPFFLSDSYMFISENIWLFLVFFSALFFVWGSDARLYFKLNIAFDKKSVIYGRSIYYSVFVSLIDLFPFFILAGEFIGYEFVSIAVFLYFSSIFVATHLVVIKNCLMIDKNKG